MTNPSSLMVASESTASTRVRAGGATARQARLQDAVNIFDLVNSLSGDGTLLRRSYAEICENVRDFFVAESEAGNFLGCGALHLYGPHLAEVRSIVVKPEAKGQGAGGRLLLALLEEADLQGVVSVCMFTRIPSSISGSGWPTAPRCQTRFTRTARPVRACMPATRLPWCADRCPGSPCWGRPGLPSRSW
jgi:amino-acid N-acetyltransferase